MASDYLPQADTALTAWVTNFITYAGANLAALGLVAADLTPVSNVATAFNNAYDADMTAQASAQSARQTKDDARATLENEVRSLVNRLQASPAVDNTARQALGITVRDTIRTPAAAPTSRPVGLVDTSQRLRHIVGFAGEGTPTSRAKPAGVQGCEIWVKVGGPPPTDASELSFLALDTRPPYVADYDGSDASQTAPTMLRRVNTRGERGPWSQTVSATIPG